MKRKKSKPKTGNVLDFKKILNQKKINDMCNLDDDDFKLAVTQSLLSIVETMDMNNKKFRESFDGIIGHLKIINEEMHFLKQVLYMERILNGQLRNGPMTMEQKASMAKAFGIDFDKFLKQVTDVGKPHRKGKKELPPK
ncbi:MAG: hypothetical protein FJ139_03985 [Deltaproteobacteria bacterium]|nr:hypothetical protein [Deltaproteobacteria bacterium]